MASVASQYDKGFISTINFLDRRDLWKQLLDITNEEASFLDLMEMLGRSVPTDVPVYRTFKNTELFANVTSAGTSQGASADIQTVTLSTADAAKCRVNDLVLLESKKVALIYSKTSTTVVLHSVDQTDISADCASGKLMVPFSSAYGEGTTGPTEHRRFDVTTDYNIVQIFKEKYTSTDIELSSKIEFDVKGKPYYFLKAQHEHLVRFRAEVAMGLIFGRQSDINFTSSSPTLTDASSNPIQTTKGLNQYIEEDGIGLSGAQTLGLATYAALARKFAKDRTPKNFLVLYGIEQAIAHDDVFSNLSSGAVFSDQARLMVDGKELDLGLKRLKIYDYNFDFKRLPVLDHKNIINFTGSAGYEKRAFYIPNEKIKSAVDGKLMDRMMLRYQEAVDGYFDNRYRERYTGGLVPKSMGGPTDDSDTLSITYVSTQGLHVNGAEHFALMDIA